MEQTNTKSCTKCGRTLPLSNFYKDKKNSDGHRNQCKDCCKKASKEQAARSKKLKSEKKAELRLYTSRELIDELIDRGYRGKLYYTQEIKFEK